MHAKGKKKSKYEKSKTINSCGSYLLIKPAARVCSQNVEHRISNTEYPSVRHTHVEQKKWRGNGNKWKNQGGCRCNGFFCWDPPKTLLLGSPQTSCVGISPRDPSSVEGCDPSSVEGSELRHFDRKKPPPPGVFPIYYVPSSRTVSKRTPLEEFVPGSSRGVLLLTVLDGRT